MDLSLEFLTPIENRHPSKVVSRSRTPNIFIPWPETAYSSRTTEIWRKLRVSTRPRQSRSVELVDGLGSLEASGSPSILHG